MIGDPTWKGFLLYLRQRLGITEHKIQISSEAMNVTNTAFVGEDVVMIVAAWTHLKGVGWESFWQDERGLDSKQAKNYA